MTLENMRTEKKRIRNRYGILCFLKRVGTCFFLDSTLESSTLSSIIYNSNPLLYTLSTLEDFNEYSCISFDYNNALKYIRTFDVFKQRFPSLFKDTKAIILEEAYAYPNKSNKWVRYILHEMRDDLIEVPDFGFTIHLLYNEHVTNTRYNENKKALLPLGQMRIFENGKWRTSKSTDEESAIITSLGSFADIIKKKPSASKQKPGSVSGGTSSTIRGRIEKSDKGSELYIITGGRKGRKCTTFTPISSLLSIFDSLEIPVDVSEEVLSMHPDALKSILTKRKLQFPRILISCENMLPLSPRVKVICVC